MQIPGGPSPSSMGQRYSDRWDRMPAIERWWAVARGCVGHVPVPASGALAPIGVAMAMATIGPGRDAATRRSCGAQARVEAWESAGNGRLAHRGGRRRRCRDAGVSDKRHPPRRAAAVATWSFERVGRRDRRKAGASPDGAATDVGRRGQGRLEAPSLSSQVGFSGKARGRPIEPILGPSVRAVRARARAGFSPAALEAMRHTPDPRGHGGRRPRGSAAQGRRAGRPLRSPGPA